MTWGYVAVAAATVVSGYMKNQSDKKAAKKAVSGQEAALEGYKQYNQPYYDVGTDALQRIQRLQTGDFSGFYQDPGYQFQLQQGNEALLRGAASRGALNAGGTDVDLMRYGQGLASQQYGDYYNRLAQLAGMGQSSAQGLGGTASRAAQNIGLIGSDLAQQQGANYGAMLSQLGGLGAQYFSDRRSTYAPGPVTRQPINQPPASVDVPNIPIQGRIYG